MTQESKIRVLVVDDELAIRRFLRTSLQANGYTVYEASSGDAALVEVVNKRPDLVILDLGLPGLNGFEVTRKLREWSHVPILVLSVKDEEKDKIEALDAGADDYLTKPFGVGELMARMRVAIRHANKPPDEPIFASGDLTVDLANRVVTIDGREISLTPTEYELLRILVLNAGKVLTHHQIIRALWGEGYRNETHLLRVNISNLRHKMESDPSRPSHIVTEPGVGYRLVIADDDA
jgi:two-component system, OmpR family, KDP operon response regulator KdpE